MKNFKIECLDNEAMEKMNRYVKFSIHVKNMIRKFKIEKNQSHNHYNEGMFFRKKYIYALILRFKLQFIKNKHKNYILRQKFHRG